MLIGLAVVALGVSVPGAGAASAPRDCGNLTSLDVGNIGAVNTTCATARQVVEGGFAGGPPAGWACSVPDSLGVTTCTHAGGEKVTFQFPLMRSASAIGGVSCPSVSFCATVYRGRVFTSTRPAAGPGTWSAANVDGQRGLDAVSCSSRNMCVAVDDVGNVLASSWRTKGPKAWRLARAARGHSLNGVSCTRSRLCVAVGDGVVVSSTRPTGGRSAWSLARVDKEHVLRSVACRARSLCVAVDSVGNVLTTKHPALRRQRWRSTFADPAPGCPPPAAGTTCNLPASASLQSVSCPSLVFCTAVDNVGQVITSTRPTVSWRVSTAETVKPCGPEAYGCVGSLTGVSCPAVSLCVAVDNQGDVVTSTNPLDPASGWTATSVEAGTSNQGPTLLLGVSCPSSSLCVALDEFGNVVTSRQPTGGASTWRIANLTP